MKKIVLLFTVVAAAFTVHADEGGQGSESFAYLTFETTDGAKASVSVSSLSLVISGNTLTAGTQSFTLSNLSKMYFSTSAEMTTGTESIGDLAVDDASECQYFDLQGHKVTKAQMRKGAYIIKTKQGTSKIIVK